MFVHMKDKVYKYMSYIFSSNENNYTFKKLDNMLINMPEKDGHHVLIRETVDGVPQYLWGSAVCVVKANEAYIFEYTPTSTEAFQGEREWNALPSGSYLVTTTVTVYISVEVFNDCDSIESVVGKGYKMNVSIDNTPLLSLPFIDTLNNLVTLTNYALAEIGDFPHVISATTNIPSLVCLGGVKSIMIVFEHLGDVGSNEVAPGTTSSFHASSDSS